MIPDTSGAAPGRSIAVVSPSSPIRDERAFEQGLSLLARRWDVSTPAAVRACKGFLAGTDAARARALGAAIARPGTRAVMASRGGHGATRILDMLDWEAWRDRPVPLVGFSDVTALQMAALARAGVATIHGPTVSSLAKLPGPFRHRLYHLIENPAAGWEEAPARLLSLVPGEARGPLVGGNLSVLVALVGTPWMPRLDGCVLFVEDVAEAPYRVDRMMTQLRNGGVLGSLAGIVAGEFTLCDPRQDGVTVEDVLREHGRHAGIPVASGLPAGHGGLNWSFTQSCDVLLRCGRRGSRARLSGGNRT